MTKPALDAELLAELTSLLGGGFGEFVTVFSEDTRASLAALRAAAFNHDRELLKLLAHALKGSAANASAMNLSALCAQLDALAHNGVSTEIDEQITCIEAEFNRVAEALLRTM